MFQTIFNFSSKNHLYHLPFVILIVTIQIIKLYRKNRNVDFGEEGDSRWTTLKEIQEQYKEIPDSDKHYSGIAGFQYLIIKITII